MEEQAGGLGLKQGRVRGPKWRITGIKGRGYWKTKIRRRRCTWAQNSEKG